MRAFGSQASVVNSHLISERYVAVFAAGYME